MRPTFFIAIFLLGFGLFFNLLTPTGLGLFDTAPLPTGTGFDEDMVIQLTEASSASEANPIGGVSSFPNLLWVVLGGLTNVIFVIPITSALGIPIPIAAVFNAIIIAVYVIDLLLLVRGLTQ